MHAIHDMHSVLAFIPAPGDWGKEYRLYGIMIALGALLGLELGRKLWVRQGGDPEDISAIVLWGLPAGLIGARLYHVITDHQLYDNHWFQNVFETTTLGTSPFAIWKGGLGIPGGIIVGCLVGGYAGRRRGMRLPTLLDVVAVGLPLAQAVGRWGNYFNQELFGRPTELPWALLVDGEHRPAAFLDNETFHPTFLYEMLWNLALTALLVRLHQKRVLRPGRLFALYVGGYFLGRLWVEALRSDSANVILGLRLNIWTSLLSITGVLVFFAARGLRRRPEDNYELYDDGHHWDPEVGIVPAGGATPGATDPGEGFPGFGAVPGRGTLASDSADREDTAATPGQWANGGTDETVAGEP